MERGLPVRADHRVGSVALLLEVDVVRPYLLNKLELFEQVSTVRVEDEAVPPSQGRIEVPPEGNTTPHDPMLIIRERIVAGVGLTDVGEARRL